MNELVNSLFKFDDAATFADAVRRTQPISYENQQLTTNADDQFANGEFYANLKQNMHKALSLSPFMHKDHFYALIGNIFSFYSPCVPRRSPPLEKQDSATGSKQKTTKKVCNGKKSDAAARVIKKLDPVDAQTSLPRDPRGEVKTKKIRLTPSAKNRPKQPVLDMTNCGELDNHTTQSRDTAAGEKSEKKRNSQNPVDNANVYSSDKLFMSSVPRTICQHEVEIHTEQRASADEISTRIKRCQICSTKNAVK